MISRRGNREHRRLVGAKAPGQGKPVYRDPALPPCQEDDNCFYAKTLASGALIYGGYRFLKWIIPTTWGWFKEREQKNVDAIVDQVEHDKQDVDMRAKGDVVMTGGALVGAAAGIGALNAGSADYMLGGTGAYLGGAALVLLLLGFAMRYFSSSFTEGWKNVKSRFTTCCPGSSQ